MVRRFHACGSMVIVIAAVLTASACSSGTGDGSESRGSSGSSGSSGSGGSGPGNTPRTCGQTCQDYLVAHGLNNTAWFLWNQLVAGRASGTKDTTGTCPLGGTVHITGTTSVADNGINTADIVFALVDCANTAAVYDLTFSGEVTMEGSFRSDSDFMAMTFSSPSLEVSGTLDYFDDPAVDETCPVTFAQNGTGESGTLTGRVCGRAFNSQTAIDPGGSAGSGGSGNGGSAGSSGANGVGGSAGAGGNCRCYCPDNSDCTGATEPNPCGVDADGIPEACGCPVGCR